MIRARESFSTMPRSFIRWAGSKRILLPEIVKLLPKAFNTYYEPFLGSGSLFFLLQPRRARLGDACSDLIETYQTIASDVDAVLAYLEGWRPDREFYYKLRDSVPISEAHAAARFIYLNKTCWNGLYRVNSSGKFNVPYGRPRSDNLIHAQNLRTCAALLSRRDVKLKTRGFAQALKYANAGDFVFLDPPYVTGHNNNGFIEYNEQLFSWADQRRLAAIARRLANRGVLVMVTNAHHPDVLELYPEFTVREVCRSSTIASDKRKRRQVTEAIIYSYSEVLG